MALTKKYVDSLLRLVLAVVLLSSCRPAYSAQPIAAIWANDGEDKVTRDELRATRGTNVKNSVWDGAKISIFGGRNEVVAFNLILEAGSSGAGNVSVSLNSLSGPNGAAITSAKATGNGVFDWTQRNIELFYVRYLQIKGLSLLGYNKYDERLIPMRFRRPWSGANGTGVGTWQDRPDHDKFYPDIAVPLELVPNFNIATGSNQSIWVDVYIPKGTPPGNYLGQLLVQVNGALAASVPVQLMVYNFTLPDTPSAKTMLDFDSSNINHRFLGNVYANPASAAGTQASQIRDRYFMLAHRHRISLIGDSSGDCAAPGDKPCPDWGPRLDGSLFTAAHGYNGPGVNVGNNVYSIGTYGTWSWNKGTQTDMNTHTDAWATWFGQNAAGVDYFLYLIDESSNYPQIETWAEWILNNTGPGRNVKSMATIPLPVAAAQTPSLDIPTSTMDVGITSQWQTAADQYTNDARKRFYMYNGARPGSGSFMIEDDGVSLRELAWGQYKKHINRWMYWESTYYNNYQGGTGETDVFQSAHTFGGVTGIDPVLGETGWNHSNGDGLLFYPGTDLVYPNSSYGVAGPFASLRLKYWRRGLQDVDYLTMAASIDPTNTTTILNQVVPKALWEYGVGNTSDPTYMHTELSWSIDPQVWEAARLKLAGILDAAALNNFGALPAPTLNLPSTLPVNAQINAQYPSGYSISGFQWSIIPMAELNAGALTAGSKIISRGGASSNNFFTASTAAQLGSMSLSPGDYQISVMAVDSNNNESPPGQAKVTLVASDLSTVRVYPNPWRSDRGYPAQVTFDHLPGGAVVKLFTVSSHWVKTPLTTGSQAVWDLTTDSGSSAASGIYLYLIKTPDGQTAEGKLALIR